MAASQCSKFIEQYYKKHGRLPEYKLVWKAAIKISEALFTSTNTQIMPCRLMVEKKCNAPKRNPCKTGIGIKGRYGCYRSSTA